MGKNNVTTKYKIAVLLDLSKNAENLVNNAVHFAKKVQGSVSLFYVKPALSLVSSESQLSAIRNIREQEKDAVNKLQALAEKVGKRENLTIPYQMASGNVKSRVKTYLEAEKPDILVLGKTRNETNLLGESITDFVMDKVKNHVLIMVEDHSLATFDQLSLGVFGKKIPEKGLGIIKDLRHGNEKEVRVFQIKNHAEQLPKNHETLGKTVDYVFTEGGNALNSLVNYVSKTRTELLCIPRESSSTFAFKTKPSKEVLRKSDVPILILGS